MVGRLIIRETHQKCKESVPQGHGKNKLQVRKSESVVMEIERHLNNRPLMYVESELGEEQVLTLNLLL